MEFTVWSAISAFTKNILVMVVLVKRCYFIKKEIQSVEVSGRRDASLYSEHRWHFGSIHRRSVAISYEAGFNVWIYYIPRGC